MSRHEDSHMYDDNPEAVNVSPNRPPQFNASTCGYRCGWGCGEPVGGDDDGGGYESDETPTLIGSGPEDGEEVEQAEIDADGASPLGPSDLQQGIEDEPMPIVVDDIQDNILLNLPISVQTEVFSPEHSEQEYQESADSLENGAASEAPSSAASDRRSIGSASPLGWDAGMGAWDDMDKIGRFSGRLPGYFCATPLRLSPQYEHCRGNAASHLVLQDFSMLLETGMENYRLRTFSRGFPLYLDDAPNYHETMAAE